MCSVQLSSVYKYTVKKTCSFLAKCLFILCRRIKMRMRYLPPRNASVYASIIMHVSIMKYIQS